MKRRKSPIEIRNILYRIRSGLLVLSVGLIIVFIYEFYLVNFNTSELFGERRFDKYDFFVSPVAYVSEKYRVLCGIVGVYMLYYYLFKFTPEKIEETVKKQTNQKPKP